MTGLLDLPDEMILIIVNFLQQVQTQIPLPFSEWGNAYGKAITQYPLQRVNDLRSLSSVSRRFNHLVKPTLYRTICVRENTYRNHPLEQLKRTLENNPRLEEHITSAIVPCQDSILDVYGFFWAPNIQRLAILRFNDWEPLEWENDSHVGTSPVTTLKLIDCGAHEEALAAVLSWPAALEALHYDVEQGEWDGHYSDQPVKSWTCAAFVRTLQSQKDTLRELTLTRPPLVHEGLGDGPRIDLSDFMALTTLRIYHVFLCGWDDRLEAWRSLPRNLEELEVFYDDTDLTRFDEDEFLRGLLAHKRAQLPRLRRVSINSPETTWDSEAEACKPSGPWTPPSPLARACETAGVKLDVYLGITEPPKYEELDLPQLLNQPGTRRRLD